MTHENQWVVIDRKFNAPIETLWKMWTDPKLFKQWYGPNGMQIPVAEMDVTIGGKRKICMEMNKGSHTMTMWFSGEFKEINPPTRLVYTESMCDSDGNIIAPQTMGMPAGHPDVTEVIIELTANEDQTHMKLIHIGVPAGSNGAGGWNHAFDTLAAQLRA